MNAFLVGCIPLGLIVIYNLLRSNILVDLRYAAATHYASGRQSLFLSFAFSYFLVQSLTVKGKNTGKVLLMAITGLLVVVAQNRTLYISLPIASIFLFFLLDRRTRTKYWKMLGRFLMVGSMLLLLANTFHSGLLIKRIIKSGTGVVQYQEDVTGVFRLFVWVQEIAKIKTHPWLGEYFGSSFRFWAPGAVLFKGLDPHNAYITIALKMGLIGLTVFLWVVGFFYWGSLKYVRANRGTHGQEILLFVLVTLANLLIFIGFNAELSNAGSGVFIWILMGIGLFLMRPAPNAKPVAQS